MAISFEELPPEILIDIILQVKRARDLLKFALCSHFFFDLATPYLYSNVVLNIRDTSPYPNINQLDHFTSFVLERPYVAGHVRTLILCDKWPDSLYRDGLYLDPGLFAPRFGLPEEGLRKTWEELGSSLQKAVQLFSQSIEEEHTWIMDSTQLQYADALIALLIQALINLERLEVPLAHAEVYYQRMMKGFSAIKHPFNTRPIYQSLKDIIYIWDVEVEGISSSVLFPLFDLPSLRSILGFRIGCESREPVKTFHRLKSGVSSLTYLELRECKICPQDIANMLRACKSLKTFILGWTSWFSLYEADSEVLFEALASTRKSLENLWLDQIFTQNHDQSHRPALVSLAAFEMLKHVKFDIGILFGAGTRITNYDLAEMVPSTIQSINFTNCGSRRQYLMIQLEDLVIKKELVAPNLKTIELEHFEYCDGSHCDIINFKSLARTAGIVVNALPGYDDPKTKGWKTAGCTI